jgi:hypothetical protein
VIEDVAAPTRPGKRRWNASFNPLEVGKQWCFAELEKIAVVQTLSDTPPKPYGRRRDCTSRARQCRMCGTPTVSMRS